MRSVISLLVAVLVGYSLSIVINTSVSAATLANFGIEVSLSDRINMVGTEWVGLGSIYLPSYFVLHAISFWLLSLFLRRTVLAVAMTRAIYAGVGALSLMAFYLAFDAVLGSDGVVVASTRTTAGLFANAATGAASGFLFRWLSDRSTQTE